MVGALLGGMRLAEGDNFVISARHGLAICQVWSRPDLSTDRGAENAHQMVTFLLEEVLRAGGAYRGVIFDIRRGPSTFGPKTREALEQLLTRGIERRVRVAMLTSESATQRLQARGLCQRTPSMTQVFQDEPSALQWIDSGPSSKPPI